MQPYPERVFSNSDEFLARVLEKAGSKAAIERALGYPSSRIAELYKKPGEKRKKTLTMEEGVKLAVAFDIPLPPQQSVTEAQLIPVLEVLMRYAPKAEWSDRDVQRLAQDLVVGLRLQERLGSRPQAPGQAQEDDPNGDQPSPDKPA